MLNEHMANHNVIPQLDINNENENRTMENNDSINDKSENNQNEDSITKNDDLETLKRILDVHKLEMNRDLVSQLEYFKTSFQINLHDNILLARFLLTIHDRMSVNSRVNK